MKLKMHQLAYLFIEFDSKTHKEYMC